MAKKLFIIFLFYVVCVCSLQSQDKRLIINKLNSNNGLSSNLVSGVLQDKYGFIWVATNVGLNRFDGVSVKKYQYNPSDSFSLPSDKVRAIKMDRMDRIWIGSGKGLSRFDDASGKFINYSLHRDKIDIPPTMVNNIMFDANNLMWVTQDDLPSLYLIDPVNEKILFDSKNTALKNFVLPNDQYRIRFIDADNRLWMVCDRRVICLNYTQDSVSLSWHFTGNYRENIAFEPNPGTVFEASDHSIYMANHGLFRFDTSKPGEGLKYIDIFPEKYPGSDLDFDILSIQEDAEKNIWIVTRNYGLIKYNPNTNQEPNPIYYHEGKLASTAKIETDEKNNLWIFTDDGYLGRFFPDENRVHFYEKNPDSPYAFSLFALPHSPIQQIFIDHSGTHWFNTGNSGLNYFNLEKAQFDLFQHEEYDKNSLLSNKIWAIAEDHAQRVWIGANGLNLYDPHSGNITRFNRNIDPGLKYIHDNILTICEIFENNLLISSSSRLIWLSYQDEKLEIVRDFTPYEEGGDRLAGWAPFYVFTDSEMFIWIGTRYGISKIHLDSFRNGNFSFTNFYHEEENPNTLSNNHIWYFYEDMRGRIWIVTDENVCVYNKKSDRFNLLSMDILDESNRNIYYPRCILENPAGVYWIATEGFGLIKYVESTGSFTQYTTQNGFPSNYLYSVLDDESGFLWLSSISGLIHFDPNSLKIELYTKNNGLQDNQFIAGSFYKSPYDGKMYFGGNNGLNAFYPDEIEPSGFSPPIVFTNLKIYNKDIDPGEKLNGKTILEKSINLVEQITLAYKERIFSIDFAALDYAAPNNIRYKYRLEGFEDHQNEVAYPNSMASYSGLPPGSYVLHVQSTNSDGYWQNNHRALKIEILAPWWLTWWAFLLYTSTLLFIAGIAFRIFYVRQKLKNRIKIEQIKTSKAEEIEQMKTMFFTNISHEFRSPLTLIISPLQKLREMPVRDEMVRYYYDIIHQNASRLLKLVNQILDFSKLEAGHLKLQVAQEDLHAALDEVVKSFGQMIAERKLKLHYRYHAVEQLAWFDQDKLEKIVSNLLSNAIKHTPVGEKIELTVDDIQMAGQDQLKYIKIAIKNYGISLPADVSQKLFDRYFQYGNDVSPFEKGMGLGLAIAKRLVELHKGQIGVEQKPDRYVQFWFTLCVDKRGFHEGSFHQTIDGIEQKLSKTMIEPDAEAKAEEQEKAHAINTGKETILIVEDEYDLRNYLRRELSNNFQVITAPDGNQGINAAFEQLPDLVITDVMMPDTDGYTLCKTLKNDERTSHIPVIILTAKSNTEDEQAGLQTGADDYIPKPFSLQSLVLKIHNIFKSRQALQLKLTGHLEVKPSSIQINSIDRNIIDKATRIVEENISDQEFNVDRFSKEMAMSKTVLFTKLKALTGLSATGFIRLIRLKRAARLLRDGQLSVSEVSTMVGFKNRNYFTQRFIEFYKIAPSEYKNQD